MVLEASGNWKDSLHEKNLVKPHKNKFHPFEFRFCGLSGTGKTTIIEKLVRRWTQRGIEVGYLKHDTHGFEMDRQGKDTARIMSQGASCVAINDSTQLAYLDRDPAPERLIPLFRQADVLFIEGYKDSPLPKIVVLDEKLEVLERLSPPLLTHPIAYLGPWEKAPIPLNGPYFSRNDLDGIDAHLSTYLAHQMEQTPLYGLILAGGKSRRMGTDKAFLKYYGDQNQIERCYSLLSPRCSQVYLSVRSDQLPQIASTQLATLKIVTDKFAGFGPLGGMLSAWMESPEAAFLILAVDLPGVTPEALDQLIKARQPLVFATTFRSLDGQYPEPLCGIYEPKARAALLHELAEGQQCPRKFLAKSKIVCLPHPEQTSVLSNINHQFERVRYLDQMGPSMI